ncbi:MAG TPA: L-rhamnose/proton symporter RhaT [Opitutaceae bacterium]|nr:L-rhamnose/proton symporter RhaT [Opitutaceae bacterium]
MLPPAHNPILGTGLHAVGAASAALCYAPQRYLHQWSWQTYWLVQAAACWLVLPWIFAWFTIPELGAVLREAPGGAMWKSYLLGVVYGVGGIAFGVAIKHIGFSLTYALAIGISCVLGTLLPPILAGKLAETVQSDAGIYVVAGVLLGGGAMIVTGLAGFRKERELAGSAANASFNPRVGLPIVVLAGVLSAVFSFSLEAGKPIAAIAAQHGAGHFQGNVIYLFSNSGAFTTTLFYAGWVGIKAGTWGELLRTPDGIGLFRNYFLSFVTGLLWYLQFFFYGLGNVRMGRFDFSSWAIHMTILILLSCGFGVAIGEWKACQPKTKWMIGAAVVLLFAAVGLLTYGNYLAKPPAAAA